MVHFCFSLSSYVSDTEHLKLNTETQIVGTLQETLSLRCKFKRFILCILSSTYTAHQCYCLLRSNVKKTCLSHPLLPQGSEWWTWFMFQTLSAGKSNPCVIASQQTGFWESTFMLTKISSIKHMLAHNLEKLKYPIKEYINLEWYIHIYLWVIQSHVIICIVHWLLHQSAMSIKAQAHNPTNLSHLCVPALYCDQPTCLFQWKKNCDTVM